MLPRKLAKGALRILNLNYAIEFPSRQCQSGSKPFPFNRWENVPWLASMAYIWIRNTLRPKRCPQGRFRPAGA